MTNINTASHRPVATVSSPSARGGQDGWVRVVVSFVAGWGHAEPLLPVALLAKRLGNDVTFTGQAALGERIGRLGFGFDAVGPDTLATTPRPLVPIDRGAERAVMRDHFVAGYGHRRATALRDLFDREHVDLVICDDVDVGAVIAAERRGISCVTVNVIAAGLLNHRTVVQSAWEQLRSNHGLPPDPETRRIGGELEIAPLPRSLRSPHAPVPPVMRFVRPPILAGLRSHPGVTNRRSLVFVTLGTVFNLESGDLLARLVQAMNTLSTTDQIDALIATGPNIQTHDLPRPAPGVQIESFVPQREVLSRCRAVVCHGGSGTLIDALSLGIPVVVLPLGADQADNADRCEALGTGITLDPLTVASTAIADATRAVIDGSTYSEACASLAAEAITQPSLEDVAELRQLLAMS
jgi:UDP:flavonoid glycosyltransferase YjiC (YdhE family)